MNNAGGRIAKGESFSLLMLNSTVFKVDAVGWDALGDLGQELRIHFILNFNDDKEIKYEFKII